MVHYLPSYSPDYNPIETFFKNVKGELRGPNRDLYKSFDDVYGKDQGAVEKIQMATNTLRPELFKKLMQDSGYNKFWWWRQVLMITIDVLYTLPGLKIIMWCIVGGNQGDLIAEILS